MADARRMSSSSLPTTFAVVVVLGGHVIINFDVPNPQVNLFSPPCSHSEFELARTIDSEVRKLENDWNTARVLELEVGDTPSIRRNQALCESGA